MPRERDDLCPRTAWIEKGVQMTRAVADISLWADWKMLYREEHLQREFREPCI